MRKPKWTKQDSARAIKEGWDIFETDRDGVRRLEIQKLDEADVFVFDEESVDFVLRHAKRRKHCRKAIQIVYGF